jgi:fatty acid synthase subunit alpha
MGLVRYHNGTLHGKDYCGWVDLETDNPITDAHIKAKYEAYMLEHTGIRAVERQPHDLADPSQTQMLHEVFVAEDLDPFEVSLETAEDFSRQHGDRVTVVPTADGDNATVTIRKGVTLFIPKSASSRGTIGAQMPTGWDARRYGIPDDIIAQVDPVTLYALVSTVEAFLSAGITDPYELYEHLHVSDVGNAVGTSLGGLRSLHEMFKQRFLDRQVQKDILAETFVNTTAAWINMLLLGSSGPIRTPVGACATSLESVDTGYDLIMNGKAKAVLVGGTDYLERDIATEFANMQATIDAGKDAARGRTTKQGSRPTASSRAGFVEGEGCGIQLLTTARLALDMGLPVHAIIALTHMAADGIGRSVPAPGKGVLTAATEKPSAAATMPDLATRRRRLHRRQRQIEAKRAMDLRWISARLNASATASGDSGSHEEQHHDLVSPMTPLSASTTSPEAMHAHMASLVDEVNAEAARASKDALNSFGNDFYRKTGDAIAPLRGALAVWGLTVDDIEVASLHGTSTVMNDINETSVIQSQLKQLGRTPGNVLACVAQKSLLGHGKGAAGKPRVSSSSSQISMLTAHIRCSCFKRVPSDAQIGHHPGKPQCRQHRLGARLTRPAILPLKNVPASRYAQSFQRHLIRLRAEGCPGDWHQCPLSLCNTQRESVCRV